MKNHKVWKEVVLGIRTNLVEDDDNGIGRKWKGIISLQMSYATLYVCAQDLNIWRSLHSFSVKESWNE